ncbi:MAG: hypothetical protein QXD62_02285 [Candidatus Woesearchaeota archaeon]
MENLRFSYENQKLYEDSILSPLKKTIKSEFNIQSEDVKSELEKIIQSGNEKAKIAKKTLISLENCVTFMSLWDLYESLKVYDKKKKINSIVGAIGGAITTALTKEYFGLTSWLFIPAGSAIGFIQARSYKKNDFYSKYGEMRQEEINKDLVNLAKEVVKKDNESIENYLLRIETVASDVANKYQNKITDWKSFADRLLKYF